MLDIIKQAPLTSIIVAITCIVSYLAFQNRELLDKLIFHPYTVAREGSEKVRFLTNGFIHADMMHLILNMYVLYMFGSTVEIIFVNQLFDPMIGRVLYLLLYFGAVIVACIPAFMKHKDNPNYRSLGASGGTSAILLAYCLFYPWNWLLLFFIIPIPAIVAAFGYLLYSSYMSKQTSDNIAHDAHLGGAVFGIIFTLIVIFAFVPEVVPGMIEGILQGPSMPNF